MTIGGAAAAAGLTAKAVRLYESRGLVVPDRTAAGYRIYRSADIVRLRFIAAARQLGLHIDQVARIFAAADDGQQPCATTRVLVGERIGEIDHLIAVLGKLRALLVATRDAPEDVDRRAAIRPIIEGQRQ